MTTLLVKAAAVAATFLTVGVPALAFEQAQPKPALTRVALQQQVQARFAALDANKDGAVTQAEFDAQRARLRGERRSAAFARLDADKSGQLSRDEFVGGADKDRAGAAPIRGKAGGGHGHGRGHGMRGGMGSFAMLDADKDGHVTLAEATARPLARFDAVDKDKDGQITPEERKAARDAMRAARAARRG